MSQHNEVKNFQRIYNALYYGRTTWFKGKPKNYVEQRLSMAQIEELGRKNPASVTAKALKIYKTELAINNQMKLLTGLRREQKKTQLENWVFAEIHRYCASHSGLFSKTSNSKHQLSHFREDLKRIDYANQWWVIRPKGHRSTIIEEQLDIPQPILPKF